LPVEVVRKEAGHGLAVVESEWVASVFIQYNHESSYSVRLRSLSGAATPIKRWSLAYN